MNARRRVTGADDGYTMMELLVAMSIFATVLSVFLTGVVIMYKDTTKTQAIGSSADALRKSFLTLDRQVRYADAVNFPGAVNGTVYVEFRIPGQAGAQATCRQWRYTANGTLDQRSWPATAAPSGTWLTTATGLAPAPSVTPFVLQAAGAEVAHQKLTVDIRSTGKADAVGHLQATFVAGNSTVNSPGNQNNNVKGVSDSPVCSPSTSRS